MVFLFISLIKSLIGMSIVNFCHVGEILIGPVSWRLKWEIGRISASLANVSAISLKKSPLCALTLNRLTVSSLLWIVSIILIHIVQFLILSNFFLVNLGWGFEILLKVSIQAWLSV